jgi:hypothetical protein
MEKNSTTCLSFLRKLALAASLLFAAVTTKAQITVNEGFDNPGPFFASDLPFGWSQAKIVGADPNNYWDRSGNPSTGAAWVPACQPHGGIGALCYHSYLATAGDLCIAVSRPYDLANRPAATSSNFSFWMYRDETWASYYDSLEVYINTVPNLSGGSPLLLVETGTSSTGITRWCSGNPVVTCPVSYNVSGWHQYFYTIPGSPASSGWNISTDYIILKGCSRFGADIFIDDFSIVTYPKQQSFVSCGLDQQNVAIVGPNSVNNWVVGMKIVTDGAGSPLVLDSVLFNTNGSTCPTCDISSSKLWWTGGSPSFTTSGVVVAAPIANPTTNTYFFPPAFRTTFSCVNAASTITVASNQGIAVGMRVDGAGIAPSATVTAIAGTTITLSATNTANTAAGAPCNFANYLNITPVATTFSCASGAFTITVASNAGITIGMTLSGAGIAAGAIVTNVAGTTITLSAANTATMGAGTPVTLTPSRFILDTGPNYFWITYDIKPSAPAVLSDCVDADFAGIIYQNPASCYNCVVGQAYTAPNPLSSSTMPGCRTIDIAYCGGVTPFYFVGPSWSNYCTNDFIQNVTMAGEVAYPPGINNSCNSNAIPPGSCWIGPCCPFSFNPPAYERFNPTPTRTAVLKADGTTVYPVSLQNGTYGSGNCLAAWIDFNHDGIFNNTMWNVGGEKLLQTQYATPIFGNPANGITSGTFTCPVTSSIGTTTMRVREVWINGNIDPCASATYGETEDYQITIIPDCNSGIPTLAGWNVWLGGFSNDWNVAQNWCGGVPTIASKAAITTAIAATYQPVIKAGVTATCQKLRIEGADTLTINAYSGGSLTVADSVTIKNNNSAFRVISSFTDTTQLSNGTNNNSLYYPFAAMRQRRLQIVYTAAELSAKGWLDGDIIDKMIFNIAKRGSVLQTQGYTNYQIYFYYTFPFFCFSGNTPAPDVQVALPTGPTTRGVLYSNPGGFLLSTIAFSSAGQYTIPLQTPLKWIGSTGYSLVIQITYSTPTTAGMQNDWSYETQTLGCKSVFLNYSVVGAAALPNDTTQVAVTGGGYSAITTDYRPNITYHLTRPYIKYPITVNGSWGNNGTFTHGYTKMTFSGGSPQDIGGTSVTNFYDLTINNSSGVSLLNNDTLQGDTLNLIAGALKLNTYTFVDTNRLITSVQRTAGWLQSETVPPTYGLFRWYMSTVTGAHVFPFGNAAGAYIPFTFDAVQGNNDVSVATYATSPANLPLPNTVLNVNNFYTNLNNSANCVDRFWQINSVGSATPKANVTFTWDPAENASTGNVNMRAQRWDNSVPKWQDPSMFVGQSNPTAQSVLVPNVTQFSPWAVVNRDQPLPISLLSFNARPEKDRVKITWSTASEINNDFFTIERTKNTSEFDFIDKVKSRGPSTSVLDYMTYDNHPLMGLQYYRLTQTDYNGESTYSNLVPVTFGEKKFDIITVGNSDNGTRTVYFNYDNNSLVSFKLIDMYGRIVNVKNNFGAVEGLNVLDLSSKGMASGVYTLIISDNTRSVSRKIFF